MNAHSASGAPRTWRGFRYSPVIAMAMAGLVGAAIGITSVALAGGDAAPALTTVPAPEGPPLYAARPLPRVRRIDNRPLYLAVGRGVSMLPLVPEGAALAYIPASHALTIGIGDIVIYDSATCPTPQGQVAHRIVGANDQGFVVQGDANAIPDVCLVRREMITGVVAGVLWASQDPARGVP